MTPSDLIFWYTGATVWAVIAIALAIAVVCAIAAAFYRMHRAAPAWRFLRLLSGFPTIQDQAQIQAGFDEACREGVPFAGDWSKCERWAIAFLRGYRRALKGGKGRKS